MRTIAISQLKGGVGKSNLALSLSYVISNEFNKKCLLIDMDSQSSSSILLGVTPNNYDKRTPFTDIPEALRKLDNEDLSYEIDYLDGPDEEDDDYEDEMSVQGIHTIFEDMLDRGLETKSIPTISKDVVDECIHTPTFSITETITNDDGKTMKGPDGKVLREKVKYEFGFDVLPSTEYLSDIQLSWTEAHMGKVNFAYRGRQLKMVVDFIAKNYDYDYCIIDCAPSLDLTTANAICAADGIVIPVSQDKQSLYSLKRIKRNIKTIKNGTPGHLGILGVVLTIYNERRTVDQYIAKTIGKDLRLHVFKTKISETNDAKKAVLSGLILPQINTKNYKENIELFKEIEAQMDFLEKKYR